MAAKKTKKTNADREIDLHGYTAAEATVRLNKLWSTREWQGLQRVRVIHGTGSVLHALVKLWCEEKGIAWTVETHNPGVTILHPGRRVQTAAPPPHRPLHPLKKHRPAAKQRDTMAVSAHPDDGLSDEERMAREFARLGEAEERALLRRKRSQEPGPHVDLPRLRERPADSLGAALPESSAAGDAMAEEFERLGEDDSLTLFKRKRDLLPQRLAPKSAQSDNVAPHHEALPPPAEPDLMAQEFARLAGEAPQAIRKRKRN